MLEPAVQGRELGNEKPNGSNLFKIDLGNITFIIITLINGER